MVNVSIPRGTRHYGSMKTYAVVAARAGISEIPNQAAATICSWYQTPRGRGEVFTRLTSYLPVPLTDVLDAIASERAEILRAGPALGIGSQLQSLDALATWAMNGSGSSE